MIFPNLTVEEWCSRYPDLSPESEPCDECGRPRTPTIPFAEHSWAGLKAPSCPCGRAGDFAIRVSRTANAVAIHAAAFESLES